MTQNTTINTSHTVTSPLPILLPLIHVEFNVDAADEDDDDDEDEVLLNEAIVITNKNITFINDSNENIINGLKR